MINIMVGIRLAAGRASSEPQRAVDRYDFVMKEKFSILPNTGMVDRARGGRRSLVSQTMREQHALRTPLVICPSFFIYAKPVEPQPVNICGYTPELAVYPCTKAGS